MVAYLGGFPVLLSHGPHPLRFLHCAPYGCILLILCISLLSSDVSQSCVLSAQG